MTGSTGPGSTGPGSTGPGSTGPGTGSTGRRAVLALGSNLGDRLATLQGGVDALLGPPGLALVALSPVYETVPVGGPPQPEYLNAVRHRRYHAARGGPAAPLPGGGGGLRARPRGGLGSANPGRGCHRLR